MLLFSLLLIPVFVAAQIHTPCTGGRPEPVEVRVPGCVAAPCPVVQGQVTYAEMDFVAPAGALGLSPYIWLTVGAEHIQFPIDPEFQDACQFLTNGACPLTIGGSATFTILIPVPDWLIGVLTAEVSLLDQSGDTVVCTVVDVMVNTP